MGGGVNIWYQKKLRACQNLFEKRGGVKTFSKKGSQIFKKKIGAGWRWKTKKMGEEPEMDSKKMGGEGGDTRPKTMCQGVLTPSLGFPVHNKPLCSNHIWIENEGPCNTELLYSILELQAAFASLSFFCFAYFCFALFNFFCRYAKSVDVLSVSIAKCAECDNFTVASVRCGECQYTKCEYVILRVCQCA